MPINQQIKIANQAWAQLSAAVVEIDTTIAVVDASLFPVLGVDEYFYGTLVNLSNIIEIVKVTDITANVLTVERAAEGTTAKVFNTTDRIELRVTAATIFDLFTQNSIDAAASEANALASAAIAVSSNIRSAVVHASSTKNVLVVNSVPPFGSLTKDLVIMVEITHDANDIAGATLNVDGLGDVLIGRDENVDLLVGDTGGNGAKKLFAYSEATGNWVLTNPTMIQGSGLGGKSYLPQHSIGSLDIKLQSIFGSHILSESIGTTQIKNDGVGQTEIQSNAVHTSELSTASTINDFEIGFAFGGSEDRQVISANTGHGFYPRVSLFNHTGTFGSNWYIFSSQGGNYSLANYLTLVGNPGFTEGVQGQSYCRYVDSSAPWNMGHGDIALFITLRVSEAGEVTGGNTSESPVWGYNGKTDVTPDRVSKYLSEDGSEYFTKKFKMIEDPEASIILPPWRGGDPAQWNTAAAEAYSDKPMIEVEIGQEMKMRDMDELPHGFLDKQETDTIVLIEPTSPIVDSLRCIHECNETSITGLFRDGYLVIGDLVSGYKTPLGVEVRSVSWAVS